MRQIQLHIYPYINNGRPNKLTLHNAARNYRGRERESFIHLFRKFAALTSIAINRMMKLRFE